MLNNINCDFDNVVKQTVFLDAGHDEDYQKKVDEYSNAIRESYGTFYPSTGFIAQPIENSTKLALEAYVLRDPSGSMEILHRSLDDIHYTLVTTPRYREIYAAGLSIKGEGELHDRAQEAFTCMQEVLNRENFSFSDVVRQWNYVEGITNKRGDREQVQNYQLFNDVRSRFYEKSSFPNGYPSATCIGTVTGGVTLEFIAVASPELSIHPLNNPEQTDAYEYSERVLIGRGTGTDYCKTTPKFERGKIVKNNGQGRIYISGTAAVIGELTSHVNDVEKQTLTTIDNINKVLSPENLANFGIGGAFDKRKYAYVRSYVKYQEDIDVVRRICENLIQSDHYQYLVSDVCRDDLLVEIEGSVNFQFRNG